MNSSDKYDLQPKDFYLWPEAAMSGQLLTYSINFCTWLPTCPHRSNFVLCDLIVDACNQEVLHLASSTLRIMIFPVLPAESHIGNLVINPHPVSAISFKISTWITAFMTVGTEYFEPTAARCRNVPSRGCTVISHMIVHRDNRVQSYRYHMSWCYIVCA